jgi:hypothetical protein
MISTNAVSSSEVWGAEFVEVVVGALFAVTLKLVLGVLMLLALDVDIFDVGHSNCFLLCNTCSYVARCANPHTRNC